MHEACFGDQFIGRIASEIKLLQAAADLEIDGPDVNFGQVVIQGVDQDVRVSGTPSASPASPVSSEVLSGQGGGCSLVIF